MEIKEIYSVWHNQLKARFTHFCDIRECLVKGNQTQVVALLDFNIYNATKYENGILCITRADSVRFLQLYRKKNVFYVLSSCAVRTH